MSYKKGEDVLPAHLLREVQKYINGALIYIPRAGKRAGWGRLNGSREAIKKRNEEIRALFQKGHDVEKLAAQFHLSVESVKKIVYGKNQL